MKRVKPQKHRWAYICMFCYEKFWNSFYARYSLNLSHYLLALSVAFLPEKHWMGVVSAGLAVYSALAFLEAMRVHVSVTGKLLQLEDADFADFFTFSPAHSSLGQSSPRHPEGESTGELRESHRTRPQNENIYAGTHSYPHNQIDPVQHDVEWPHQGDSSSNRALSLQTEFVTDWPSIDLSSPSIVSNKPYSDTGDEFTVNNFVTHSITSIQLVSTDEISTSDTITSAEADSSVLEREWSNGEGLDNRNGNDGLNSTEESSSSCENAPSCVNSSIIADETDTPLWTSESTGSNELTAASFPSIVLTAVPLPTIVSTSGDVLSSVSTLDVQSSVSTAVSVPTSSVLTNVTSDVSTAIHIASNIILAEIVPVSVVTSDTEVLGD